MHKIIFPGVHEIAALVAKIAFAMSLGTILPSVRIVRPENEVITFGKNSSGLTVTRFNASPFHQDAV